MVLRPVALAVSMALIPAAAGAVETMRIQMGDADAEVELAGEGLAYGLDQEDGLFTASPRGRARVRHSGGRLLLEGVVWPEERIRFRAGEESRDAGVPGHAPIRALGHEVRGDVVVRVHRGKLQVINVIPLEEYLAAVLGSEMPRTFPEEALKAQAVAARTYALHKKLEAYDQPYHLGNSVLHQVYGGVAREDPRTKAAVEATRGEVLTWELQPIEAYFHASCGGRTEHGAQALGRDLPYLPSVTCPCSALPQSRWEATVPHGELARALGGKAGAWSIAGRTRTGRVTRLLDASGRAVDGVSFRQKVGYGRIRSLHFEVRPASRDALHFSGKGFGHGAGLCQWGAKAQADGGSGYLDILAHYYPGTDLQTLY
jgi:stage II sporulation protein D